MLTLRRNIALIALGRLPFVQCRPRARRSPTTLPGWDSAGRREMTVRLELLPGLTGCQASMADLEHSIPPRGTARSDHPPVLGDGLPREQHRQCQLACARCGGWGHAVRDLSGAGEFFRHATERPDEVLGIVRIVDGAPPTRSCGGLKEAQARPRSSRPSRRPMPSVSASPVGVSASSFTATRPN